MDTEQLAELEPASSAALERFSSTRTTAASNSHPLELVKLSDLMALTRGRADIIIGLVDGSVALNHPDLATRNIRTLVATPGGCLDAGSASCRHGTFIAGILAAQRGALAPAIAPDCTLLVRPIFSEASPMGEPPSASPWELAKAIVECVDAGARILNLSAALDGGSFDPEPELEEALQYIARRGVLMVAAAGNQGAMSGSALTRHPWVIPVVGYTWAGVPLAGSNLGRSIGIRGLGGPGAGVISLVPEGEPSVSAGTSIAAPFVTGAIALLWSLFPAATAAEIKSAVLSHPVRRRRMVTPPLLDAWAAYQVLLAAQVRRAVS